MKKAHACIVTFTMVMTAALPQPSQAQFLKTLVNNAKQSIAGKQAQSKPDSTAGTKSTMDSARLAQMMAGLYKPKGGVSPADSAAAIKSFMTATGGSGMYYQYHVTTTIVTKQKDSTISDTMSLAISDSHNTRVEFGMLTLKMTILGHAATPKYSVMLYSQSKTYSLNIIDTAAGNSGDKQSYKVVKIGNETVQGYNCIHSKLTVISGNNTEATEDLWTSTSVPGYAEMEKMMTIRNVTPKMLLALEQAGCAGFFVKMMMQSKSISMSMLLINSERKSFPASLFEIPPGYAQANNMGMFSHMMQKQ